MTSVQTVALNKSAISTHLLEQSTYTPIHPLVNSFKSSIADLPCHFLGPMELLTIYCSDWPLLGWTEVCVPFISLPVTRGFRSTLASIMNEPTGQCVQHFPLQQQQRWLGDYGHTVKFILVKVCFMLHFPCAAFQPMTLVMIHHRVIEAKKRG